MTIDEAINQVGHSAEFDALINILQHPFFMGFYGIVGWFIFRYSRLKNKGQVSNWSTFWEDQKDELYVTAIFVLAFLIWDDEVLMLWHEYVKGQDPKDINTADLELARPYYLLLGAAVERIYKLFH